MHLSSKGSYEELLCVDALLKRIAVGLSGEKIRRKIQMIFGKML